MSSKRSSIMVAVVAALVLICGSEWGARISGLADFPLCERDDDFGYIPARSQAGNFLNRNAWIFNDRNMGVAEEWNPGAHKNVLLIGNSIILGGNPFDQPEKVGPLLQRELGADFQIWPIAAGGWTNVNMLKFIRKNTDISQAVNIIIFEYMRGGLGKLAPWPGEYVCPTNHKYFLSPYLIIRYLLNPLFGERVNDFGALPPVYQNSQENIDLLKQSVSTFTRSGKRVILFYYPTLIDLTNEVESFSAEKSTIFNICKDLAIECLDLSNWPTWSTDFYRADGVHPTKTGNLKIADFLAAAIKEDKRLTKKTE